jgi:NhaC family Na+:H+ antiporter
MAGVYVTGTLGIPVLSYLPWAFSNYLAVIILAIFGLTGVTMAKRKREDETEAGS